MLSQLINVTKTLQRLTISSSYKVTPKLLQETPKCSVIFTRESTNFFNKLPAEFLWKGVTSVSSAGRKRGRAKTISKKNIKDLNRGQVIGKGKANIEFPGLTVPILRGKELIQQQQLPEDPDREKMLNQIRDKMGTYKYPRMSPIERGWSGTKMPGRSIGPPDPVGEDNFEGFDTKVLELKQVFNMKGQFGRKRRIATVVVTGNGNGLAGFAMGRAIEPRAAMRKAKNRAGQKLMYIRRFRDHTVFHDFFTQFGSTKLFVSQKPEGYGLVCHRAIRTICQVIGIKDLYVKVEGSTNVQHIIKAFFLGLIRQGPYWDLTSGDTTPGGYWLKLVKPTVCHKRTHEEIAAEKSLHLVEFCRENGYFPTVLASPVKCRTKEELEKDEILDFTQYCLNGRVILKKKKYPPFYFHTKGHQLYLKKQEKLRNKWGVRTHLLARYGELKSFLTDEYPECKPFVRRPKKSEESAEEEEEEAEQ